MNVVVQALAIWAATVTLLLGTWAWAGQRHTRHLEDARPPLEPRYRGPEDDEEFMASLREQP